MELRFTNSSVLEPCNGLLQGAVNGFCYEALHGEVYLVGGNTVFFV